ncbi:MAG: MotA/TolQ/ExbB proton channel family protein [Acidobacteria bacterium]|nr:MotA/TolQ/ExbB proton channel family protein [Acidobacteriota bacterium]
MKKGLEIGTVVGLLLGVLAIFGSFMLEGGKMGALFLVPAMLIVFGGTLATAMIGSSLGQFVRIWKVAMVAFMPPKEDIGKLIEEIVEIAKAVRRQSLLSMEKELPKIGNHFLRRLLGFAIDGMDPTSIRSVADAEMNYVTERHHANAGIFQKMGGYSPTMGIIGTVMGLISTLANAGGDPNDLIHHIATAFIATLWGVFMANIVWLPIADKLKTIHGEESLSMEVVLEGVLSIQSGEAPAITKAKLQSMLPASQQEIR